MDANKPIIKNKALKIRPQWAWQTSRTSLYTRGVELFFVGSMIAFGIIAPALFMHTLFWGFSFFILFMAGLRILSLLITINAARAPLPASTNHAWPTFTILVPLYQEAHMVGVLAKHLLCAHYPHDLLDIVLVVEADDTATCRAAKQVSAPSIRVFEVPPSAPRTKPKALNAALEATPNHLRGDIITVYDAEDRPHPDQLLHAARAFMSDPELAVVQAPLGYFNDRENLLTALFGLEYAALFNVWNPALARLGLPFTLGGTSNHIRRRVLENCGGWDSYNVTEDADLSFRLHALNRTGQKLKLGTITPPTGEEAVSNLDNWTSQRSRWLKGFMQTWHVHMRIHKYAPDGGHFSLRTRIKNVFSLHITIGATLVAAFLHLPSLAVMAIIYFGGLNNTLPSGLPVAVMATGSIGYGAAILTGVIGALRADKPHLVKYVLLMPFYWLLYFWPALIAAYEIVFAPAYWRKTFHVGTGQITTHGDVTNTTKPNLEPANTPPI